MDNYEERYGYSEQPNISSPSLNHFSGVAKIKVIGVGGAGNNAVNRLIESGLQSAEYVVVNTDNQDLLRSKAKNRIQIGAELTKGLGAGADPNVGKAAAEEDKEALQMALKDTDMLFITAGMGGGTGTGAAPVIARIAKEMKILTVAVVTLPFSFEAKLRMTNALAGIEELKKSVDAIITIPNDKISQVVPKGTSFPDALKVADEVLRQGIRGIAELIVKPSLINLDFADVKTTLKGRGLAHMGIGVAKGEKRIYDAVRCAVCSPLLNTTIEGASSVILNVIGGKSLSLDEVTTAATLVKDVIDYSANVIFGACIDENMSDEVEVVIIATGFTGGQNGFGMEMQNAAFRQASILSQKLDNSYNNQTPGAFAQPTYANEPAPVAFEPDDPIPEDNQEDKGDRKHRPRFVDFFMRKNSEDK
ncbi:MAG: cell division protein FtsZ [Clostridia bacterium]|nr:cell division protein FtsZ [Clostridia bacterium]